MFLYFFFFFGNVIASTTSPYARIQWGTGGAICMIKNCTQGRPAIPYTHSLTTHYIILKLFLEVGATLALLQVWDISAGLYDFSKTRESTPLEQQPLLSGPLGAAYL